MAYTSRFHSPVSCERGLSSAFGCTSCRIVVGFRTFVIRSVIRSIGASRYEPAVQQRIMAKGRKCVEGTSPLPPRSKRVKDSVYTYAARRPR